MEATEKNSLEYGKPPWIFKGRALYQLHLVKAETARAFIPKEFKLVEAFGYTLGGFFLANYEESPAGIFDELVVIAGIVWNPPTSCAWAAKVLVNSDKACIHGRKDVGLPSQVAHFRNNVSAIPRIQKKSRFGGFLSKIGLADHPSHATNLLDVQVKEMNDHNNLATLDLCNINFTTSAMVAPRINSDWMGPKIKMSLPSFSGRTIYNPHLLKYCCQIECRLRFVSPAKVSRPCNVDGETVTTSNEEVHDVAEDKENARNLCASVLLSKPVLALEFNHLKMVVEAPTMISCSADAPTTVPQ